MRLALWPSSDTGDKGAYFVYTGQASEDIPWAVNHVRVHPSLRRIEDWAFCDCLQLAIVDLGKGLEEIGKGEFRQCTLLREIVIAPAVRVIKNLTFAGCAQLTIVILGKLEEI